MYADPTTNRALLAGAIVVPALLLAAGAVLVAQGGPPQAPSGLPRPPAALGVPSHYTKYVDARGIPIVGSARVRDEALEEARSVVEHMLARSGVHAVMVRKKARVAVMAEHEKTIDMPEFADLPARNPTGRLFVEMRGLGATWANPVTLCSEENFLALRDDPYRGTCILIHELAHSVENLALDEATVAEIGRAYAAARERKLWESTYAGSSSDEYWAEGAADWFDANLTSSPPNGVSNEIGTREALARYDPTLHAILARVFPADWRWQRP